MSTAAQAYYQSNAAAMAPVRAQLPDLLKAFAGLHQATLRPGALSTAQKELIALGIGLAVRCENCLYAHIKAALTQTQLSIPVASGIPVLGTWQAVYLFEHRRAPHEREVVLHLLGE